MFEQELIVNKLLVDYLTQLTHDIPSDEFNEQAIENTNSPAWVVGHLTVEAVITLKRVNVEVEIPELWFEFFAQNTLPREDFPSKEELLTKFKEIYDRFREEVLVLDSTQYLKDNPTKILVDYYPQMKDDISHMLTAHLGIHSGHIGMWRKAKGLDNIYGKR